MTFSARISMIAAAMMHCEGAFSVNSLPHRNNNPGNLRRWGSTSIVDGYCRFATFLDGYNALLEDIYSNRAETLRNFISKYAPPTENNTSSYLQVVCEITELKPDEQIDVPR